VKPAGAVKSSLQRGHNYTHSVVKQSEFARAVVLGVGRHRDAALRGEVIVDAAQIIISVQYSVQCTGYYCVQ
jgi:hypothetical protein